MPASTALSPKKQHQLLADRLYKETHFSKFEIGCLITVFCELTKTKLDRLMFRDVLHNQFDMTDDIIMDRVFKVFDYDNDSLISMDEWVLGMSVFLRGTMEERIRYCFNVYDFNMDGYISRDEMYSLFKKAMVKQTVDDDPDESIKDLSDLALKKMDIDFDHRISLKDFTTAVHQDGILLQGFGLCLPDPEVYGGGVLAKVWNHLLFSE